MDTGADVWTPYGKKYSGPWATRNVVKEPAFKVPQPATTTTTTEAAAVPLPAAAASAAVESQLPDAAVSGPAPLNRRQLLQQVAVTPTPLAAASEGADHHNSISSIMRQVHMKRVQRLAAQAAAAAAASGDPAESAATADALERAAYTGMHPQHAIRNRIRPMDKKPAAKAIDPEDEKTAPFAAAIGIVQPDDGRDRARDVHVGRQRPGKKAATAADTPA